MEQRERNKIGCSAAIYCRLSKDDEQAGESVSIQTQKMMLEKYCSEQGFPIYGVYADDGYSGLNFNRPEYGKCKHYHYIYYEDLYEMVLRQIRGVAKGIESGEILRRIQSKAPKQKKRDKLEAEQDKIRSRIAVLNKITKKLYEDYACELLDTDSYHRMLNEYQQEQKQLSQRSGVIQDELDQKDEFTENLQKLSEAIQKYLNVDKLTANMLNQLVERIEVGYIETVNGEKQQEISIIYRFIGMTL